MIEKRNRGIAEQSGEMIEWETQGISAKASGGFSFCLYIEFRKTFFN